MKEKIAANGDYNLTGERYRENGPRISNWPFVQVGEVFCKSNKTVRPESMKGPLHYIGLENILQDRGEITGDILQDDPSQIKSLKNVFAPNEILYGTLRPNLNKVWLSDRHGICSTDILVIQPNDERVVPLLYAHILRDGRFNAMVLTQLKGAQLPRIDWPSFAELEIPLPPLDVQNEIVAEIDGYQKVIDGARAVLENYRPHIQIDPDWPMPTFQAAAFEIIDGDRGVNYPKKGDFSPEGYCLFLNTKNVRPDGFNFCEKEFISEVKERALRKGKLQRGDVVLTTRGTVGNTGLYDESVEFENVRINSGMLIFRPCFASDEIGHFPLIG